MNEIRVWHEDDGYHVEAKECRGCVGDITLIELLDALRLFDIVRVDEGGLGEYSLFDLWSLSILAFPVGGIRHGWPDDRKSAVKP